MQGCMRWCWEGISCMLSFVFYALMRASWIQGFGVYWLPGYIGDVVSKDFVGKWDGDDHFQLCEKVRSRGLAEYVGQDFHFGGAQYIGHVGFEGGSGRCVGYVGVWQCRALDACFAQWSFNNVRPRIDVFNKRAHMHLFGPWQLLRLACWSLMLLFLADSIIRKCASQLVILSCAWIGNAICIHGSQTVACVVWDEINVIFV